MTKLIKLDALRWLKHFQNRSTADQAESLNSSSFNSPKLLLRLRFSRKVVFSGFLTSTDFSVPVKIKVGPWPKISRLNFFSGLFPISKFVEKKIGQLRVGLQIFWLAHQMVFEVSRVTPLSLSFDWCLGVTEIRSRINCWRNQNMALDKRDAHKTIFQWWQAFGAFWFFKNWIPLNHGNKLK